MTARSATRRIRRLALAALLALVAATHLLLLAGATERAPSGPRVAALVVRRIVVDAPAVPAPVPPERAAPAGRPLTAARLPPAAPAAAAGVQR